VTFKKIGIVVRVDEVHVDNRSSVNENARCRKNARLARPNDGGFVNWSVNDVCSRSRLLALSGKENF